MRKAPLRVKILRHLWAKNDAKRDAGLVEPEGMVIDRDISYGKYKKYNLLDVYRPSADKKLPVIVNIHGGGYFYGSKDLYRYYCMELAGHGFAVVNFNYRLSPEFQFPAALEDINKVFLWIEENFSKYNLDVDNLFVIGDSAGAQLTSHYATILTNKEFADKFKLEKHNIKIKAVSMACGMYDIAKRFESGKDMRIMKDYLGKNFDKTDERYIPMKYMTKDFPPAFIFSAENDFLNEECEPMYNFLKEKGVYTKMQIFGTKEEKEIAHVFHENIRHPEAKKANQMQIDFFGDVSGLRQ